MPQLLINILIRSFFILIIANSFSIIYNTAKFFYLTHAVIISFAAYFTYLLSMQSELNIWLSVLLAIISSIWLGLALEQLLFKPMRKRNTHPFTMLIASLGLYVILQNIISLVWGDDTKSIRTGLVKVGHEIIGAYITDIQVITIGIGICVFLSSLYFMNKTRLGRQMRAVSSNEDLSNMFGISSNKVILWAFGIGSGLAAIAGILVAFDTDMTPTMGFNLLLNGVVAMIIGGIGSTWGLLSGSLLLATAQHLGAYYIDSKWMDAIAYIILILFLIWKPLGFSGKRLKKIEI